VDGESGLVHLRRQLGGKSVALFGPTPVEYFGYPENVNIVAEVCGDCMWMTEDWYVNCLKGLDKPACLESIRAETVLRAVRESLDGLESYNCSILDAALYSSAGRAEYEAVFADICRACGLDKKPISENILGESGVYVHASKQWEYPYVVSQIRQLGSGLKIADVGGGRGALAWYLAASGQAVTVYDLDFSCGAADAYAGDSGFIRFAARQGFTAEYGSIFNLPADDNAFDVVACVSVIEHVHHKEYALKELLRVLKPGGRLILTYDLAGRPETLEDDNRVEIFSPAGIADFLKNFGADAGEIHSQAALDRSLADIQGDAVADIPPGMTVGALALVKSGGRA
jgi:SAM-dependent methyltransferase